MTWFKVERKEVINGKLLSLVTYNKNINERIRKGTPCAWVENPNFVFGESVVLCYGNVIILGNTVIRSETDNTIEIKDSIISNCKIITVSNGEVVIDNSSIKNTDIENIEDSPEEATPRIKNIVIKNSEISAINEFERERMKIENDGHINIFSSKIKFNAKEATIGTVTRAVVDLKNCAFECVSRLEANDEDSFLSVKNTKSVGDNGFSILTRGEMVITDSLFNGFVSLFLGTGKIHSCEFRDKFSFFSDATSLTDLSYSTFTENAQLNMRNGSITTNKSKISGSAKIICIGDAVAVLETQICDDSRVKNADLLYCKVKEKAIINNVSLRYFDVRKNSKVGFFLDGKELDKGHFQIKTVLSGEARNNLYKVEKNTDFYILRDCFDENMAIACQPKCNKYTFMETSYKRQYTFERPILVLKDTLEKSKKNIDEGTFESEILNYFFDEKPGVISIPNNTEKILEMFPRNNGKKDLIFTSIILLWNSFFSCYVDSKRDINDTIAFLKEIKQTSLVDIVSKKRLIKNSIYVIPKDVLEFVSKGKGLKNKSEMIIV